jgi:hypothetical protein
MTRILFVYCALESPKPHGTRRLPRRFPTVSLAGAAPHCGKRARNQRLGSFGIRSPPWPSPRTAIFGGEA